MPSGAFYLNFVNYFEANIESIRKTFAFSCPIFDMGFVQSLTCFVDALIGPTSRENMDALRSMSSDDQKTCYDAIFAFAMMWTVGGAVADDKTVIRGNHSSNTTCLTYVFFKVMNNAANAISRIRKVIP